MHLWKKVEFVSKQSCKRRRKDGSQESKKILKAEAMKIYKQFFLGYVTRNKNFQAVLAK